MERNNSYLIGNKHAVGSKPNSTSFKKGSEPWNKDKKGIHLSPSTEFKKGCSSLRKMELGSITRRTHKRDKPRNFIKTENGWVELSKHTWIRRYGKIIKGDIIHHINGNSTDDDIENLIAIPRSDHPIFHNRWGIWQLSDEKKSYYIGRYL